MDRTSSKLSQRQLTETTKTRQQEQQQQQQQQSQTDGTNKTNNSGSDKNKKGKISGYDDGFTHLTGIEAVLHAIWPVRYRKRATADTGELYIRTTIRNLIVYLVFLVVISIVVYGMIGLINYYYAHGMLSLYVDSDIGNGEKFSNGYFLTYDDVWTFLEGTLLNNLYFEVWYDLSNTTSDNIKYILYQNKLLGVPRLVQLRVKNNSCKISGVMSKVISSCKAPYDDDSVSKDTFGKGLTGIFENDTTYSAWVYSVEPSPQSSSFSGSVGDYPSDGFAINLAETKEDSATILADLKNNLWIDEFTRAILIDFTMYNGNVNLFTQIRLLLEFPASGGILTTSRTRVSKLLRYVASFDFVVATFEIIFILFILYFTVEEILDLRLNKCAYFKDVYNLLDLFMIAMSYATIAIGIYRTVLVGNQLDSLLTTSSSSFQNFDRLILFQETFNQMSAILVFLCWIKIFKYISLNKTLDQLNATLKKSIVDICYFCIIFFIILMCFSTLGYQLFGDTLGDYKTFGTTVFTLFRIILGDFDFLTLRAHFPLLGPAYFMAFVFFGFFVLLNMFMAIINQAYGKVKEEMSEAQPEFMLSDYLKLNYSKVVDRLNLKRDRILDIQDVLKSEQVAGKDELDFNLWRNELKKKGYADMEIQALFARYDKRHMKRLSEIEKIKLIRDIARARTVISQEFKDFKKTRDLGAKKDAFEVGDNTFNDEDDELHAAKQMTRDDFEYVVGRIDFMELSVASIINKIDRLFAHLEIMEVEKMKKRQDLAKMLQEPNNSRMEDELKKIMK